MNGRAQIRFDGWTLHCDSGELERDGATVRLPPQPLHVLLALLDRPGEVVTREELIALLWPRGVVDYDTALNSTVRRLRTALADDADAPRCIETIPRRGYRFVGRLEAQAPRGTGTTVAADAAVASAATTSSFTPPDAPDPSARAPRIPPRSWTRALAHAVPLPRPLRRVALLALAGLSLLVLVGSRGMPPLDEMPRSLAARSDARHASVGQADERERRARFLLQRRGDGDLERARSLFQRAIELDPRHARAHAGLASAYWLQTMYGERPPEVGLELLREAAEAALAIDPRSAEAHLRLSNRAMRLGQRDRRAWHLRKAYEYGASEPLILSIRASSALRSGSIEAGLRLGQRAFAAAPFDLVQRYNFAWELYMAGRPQDAVTTMRELLELDPTHRSDVLVLALVMRGSHDEALAVADRQTDALARDYCLAIAQGAAGREADAAATLARIVDAVERGEGDPLRLAEVLAFRGEHDLAFAWLERARPGIGLHRAWTGTRMPPWILARSPLAKSLRTDPRWERWWRAVT